MPIRVSRVEIYGLRSIRRLAIDVSPFQVLLGPNNCGKSNVLEALSFFFESKGKPSLADFFLGADGKRLNSIRVLVKFEQLNTTEKAAYARYLLDNDSIKIEKVAKLLEDGSIEGPEYHGILRIPKDHRFRPEHYAGKPTERFEQLQKEFGDLSKHRGSAKLSDEEVNRIVETLAREKGAGLEWEEASESSQFMGAKQVAASRLGLFLFLRAIPDPESEAGARTGSNLALVLGQVLDDISKSSTEYIEAARGLRDAVARLNPTLQDGSPNPNRPPALAKLEKDLEGELKSWDVDVELEIQPPDIESLITRPTVHLDDGYRSELSLKGHGLQRSFVLAVLSAWRSYLIQKGNVDSSSTLNRPVILAIEEPELFLHPQQQRRLLDVLVAISKTDFHHVIVASHSPIFIDIENPTSVLRMWKTREDGSSIKQLTRPLFEGETNKAKKDRFNLTRWINPDRGEMFFASRVILVEGQTEASVLSYVGEMTSTIDRDATVVDCGGKGSIPLYMQLLAAFKIPFKVIHDEDPVESKPGDKEYDEDLRVFELNKTIAGLAGAAPIINCLSPSFEDWLGISKSKGKKLSKPIAALEHIKSHGVDGRLADLVKWAYN